MVMYETVISLRSLVAVMLTPLILLLLYKTRALFPPPETT